MSFTRNPYSAAIASHCICSSTPASLTQRRLSASKRRNHHSSTSTRAHRRTRGERASCDALRSDRALLVVVEVLIVVLVLMVERSDVDAVLVAIRVRHLEIRFVVDVALGDLRDLRIIGEQVDQTFAELGTVHEDPPGLAK